jgi:hypothetical protein
MILLAGEFGALLLGETYDEHEAEALEALEALREPPPLSPGELERLAATEYGSEPARSDEDRALSAARLLASSDDQASRYLGLLRSVTRDYVFHPRFAEEVELLVPELLEHEAISGRRARQLINRP